jgi:hypothetical protein
MFVPPYASLLDGQWWSVVLVWPRCFLWNPLQNTTTAQLMQRNRQIICYVVEFSAYFKLRGTARSLTSGWHGAEYWTFPFRLHSRTRL